MLKKLNHYFLSGLIVFLPLALTIKAFFLTVNVADGFLGKYIEPYFSREFGFYFRGFGIILCIILILFIGFLVTNLLGRKIFPIFEKLLLQLPFFKQVYPAFKEISLFLFSRDNFNFRQVVLIEYPSKGIFSIGFLTNEVSKKLSEKTAQDLCYVFVPHTPSPLTGFLTLVPKDKMIFPNITTEDAIKLVISGGVVKT